MSSFREQLGEDWLRYQHHLDEAPTSVRAIQPTPPRQTLPNGLAAAAAVATPCPSTGPGLDQHPSPPVEVLDDLPPPLLSSEPRADTYDVDGDLEQESTLQWPGQSTQHTESTLEDSTVEDRVVSQGVVSTPGPSPESQRSARAESGDTKEEEEVEDLGGRVLTFVD